MGQAARAWTEGQDVGWEYKTTWGCPTEHVGWDLAVGIPDHGTAAGRTTGTPCLVCKQSSRIHIASHEKEASETHIKQDEERNNDTKSIHRIKH